MTSLDDLRKDRPSLAAGPQPFAFRDAAKFDAFNRFRVSLPETLFDSKQLYDSAPLLWDDAEISGGGTSSAHVPLEAGTRMSVSDSTAGVRVRQTFRRFNYEPGKSQLVLMTGVLCESGLDTGIRRRIGLFDGNNGLFVEVVDGVAYFVRRTYTSGTAVDNRVALPTTYNCGHDIDWSMAQILWFDIEWLGMGQVRMGLVRHGVPHLLHKEDGVGARAGVYMQTPNLPLRYEIENLGTGPAATMLHVCASVMSEGGTQSLGIPYSVSMGGTPVTLAAAGTLYGLIGIRLKPTHFGATVKFDSANGQIQTANSSVEWSGWGGATVTGGTYTWVDVPNSAVQIAIPTVPPTLSGGRMTNVVYGESGGRNVVPFGGTSATLRSALLLGSSIDGTPQEVWMAGRPIAGSSGVDVEAALTWSELL